MNDHNKSPTIGIYYVLKDAQSKIIDCNPLFLSYIGFNDIERLMGLDDFDLAWQDYAPLYRKHEVDVLNQNCYSIILPSQDISGRQFMAFINKVPTFNQENEVSGVACFNMEIINPEALHLNYLLKKTNSTTKLPAYKIGNFCREVKLTKQEQACLFYLLRGKSAKMIGKILNLSPRTVEDYTNRLKNKFCCETKAILIEKAIYCGYMEMLPQDFEVNTMITALKY